MARKSKSISKLIISMVGLAGLLSSCSSVNYINRRYYAFDTTLYFTYDGLEEFADTLVSPINNMSDLFDTYKEIPNLVNAYSVNHSNDYVEVDKDLYEILKTADDYFQDTNGLFNPLIKDVSELWKDALKNKTFPDASELANLVSIVNESTLEFKDGNKVKINGDAHIDLGAIAKGYALSILKEKIDEEEIKDYIFNAGFSSILLGENHDLNGYYRVKINNTSNKYLELKNTAIGTSSIYEQSYLEKDGKKYSHIVNGLTGSAEVKNDMVIVVSNNPILCDVYSTVGMLLSTEEIKNLEAMIDAKFVILNGGQVTYENPSLRVLEK